MNISFKNNDLFRSFCTIPRHPKLTEVLLWTSRLKKMEMVVTSDHRDKPIHDKDPGIHNTDPLRAIDLRSWTMRNPELIAEKINKAWIYDPKRPEYKVCVYHEAKKTMPDGTIKKLGFHFHCQTHDNTCRREDNNKKNQD